MSAVYCEFCGWETDNSDVRVCPKCKEYKGLIRSYDDIDLEEKIAAFIEANPEWETREP